MRSAAARAVVTCAALVLLADGRPVLLQESSTELLWQHRNLGKAFYENPTTQYEAVEEFRKALELAPDSARERLNYGLSLLRAGKTDAGIAELEKVQQQDPRLPHTWFNLGIQYKKRATPEWNGRAIAQFERMTALVPDEPASHYNLGYLYKVTGRPAEALKEFETAARSGPALAGPHFQLYNAYRAPSLGRDDDARRELQRFQEIKKRTAGAAIPEDLEWSYYSEIYDPAEVDVRVPDPPPAAPSFRDREVARGVDAATAGLAVLDADTDDRPDLVVWSSSGVQLLAGGAGPVAGAGLETLAGVVTVAPGDFDNDGAADLIVVTRDGPALWRNVGRGRFARDDKPLPSGRFTRAVWLDYDHDYDLDLLLLGPQSRLLRNSGGAGFVDVTAEFPFVEGTPLDAVPFQETADTMGRDLLVSYADRAGVLYRDSLEGKYTAVPIDTLPAGARGLVVRDINRDGSMDVAAAGPSGLLVLMSAGGHLTPTATNVTTAASLAAADFEGLGVGDLIAGGRVLRWTGGGMRDRASGRDDAAAQATADFDGDGRLDLIAVDRAGTVRLATTTAGTVRHWLRVTLTGVKNLKAAPGAVVEIKAGSRYQKAIYEGVPILFGLGDGAAVDTVRITWPNGLVQNETRQAVDRAVVFKEAARLSGSCPMIFTWDGKGFRFATDVLGVAPLGASSGDGTYFPVDHDEYVQVPGEAFAVTDGRYEVRVTEELREVSYLDRIQLIALDHPADVTVVTNDKFKAPPFPPFRLFGVKRPIAPVIARDQEGHDVRERLLADDRRYPDGYPRDFKGVAQRHHLDLDFGTAAPANRAVLVLSGWVDWADGSTFRGASQEGGGLELPYLQVRDAQGRWRTVIEDMGIPAGKPKTIAVDLAGKFLSSSREVRIVTNLCVYWDRIYLSETEAPPDVVMTPMNPALADLRFRGFSRPVIDPGRKQPEAFDYAGVRPVSTWNPTPGLYTRYGDVRPLLTAADDRLVVMGSGDELRLAFDASAAPRLRAGWRRDFLLLFDGWAKDADANTAFSQTVEPLPFHAMSAYPYGSAERFPELDTAREFNTRPALRLIRPLATGTTRR